MNQALVQDVVAEVMRRLGPRADGALSQIRAGEDEPANEGLRPEAEAQYRRKWAPES